LKKKILMGTIITIFLMLMMPHLSSVQINSIEHEIQQDIQDIYLSLKNKISSTISNSQIYNILFYIIKMIEILGNIVLLPPLFLLESISYVSYSIYTLVNQSFFLFFSHMIDILALPLVFLFTYWNGAITSSLDLAIDVGDYIEALTPVLQLIASIISGISFSFSKC